MTNLSMNPRRTPISRNKESSGIGREFFYGNPPNVRRTPDDAKIRRDKEITHLNQTMHQMKNEIIWLRRGDDANIRNSPPPQGVNVSNLGFRNRTKWNQCIESPPILNRVP